MYAEDPLAWREHFGPEGVVIKFIEKGERLPVAEYTLQEELDMHINILLGGGYTALCNR